MTTTKLRPLYTWALALVLASASAATAQEIDLSGRSDCSTPKRAALTWLANLQDDANHPAQAAECFDWDSAGVDSASVQQRQARHLKAVFDQRGLYIDVDGLPDVTEVPDEELDEGRIVLARRLPAVYLEASDAGWVISADSIRQIDRLYDETFDVDVEGFVDALPEWAKAQVLGVAIWQLLGLLVALMLGIVVRVLVSRFLMSWVTRFLRKQNQKWDQKILRKTANPLGTIAMVAVLWWMLPLFRFSVRVNQIGTIALRVMAATAVVPLLYRLVDFGADIFAKRAEKTESKFDDQIVPLIRKTLKVFVVVVGVIFVLQNLDVDVGSLLAGVSLGGLAFSLAAKDTVANLFASVSIFADQPFQIGDWVIIDGHEGTVMEVGMRSTRIRTFYDSVITVPNSIVANVAINNYSLRTYRRQVVTLGVTYDTSPEQIQAFVEGIRAIFQNNPAVRKDAYEVHFRNFGDSALELFLYFFLKVDSFSEELRQRHNLFLEIMRLAKELNVDFAFPTQTLHLETRAKETEIPARVAPPRDELEEAVLAFAAGGAKATPDTPLLTDGFFPAVSKRGDDGDGGEG